MHKRLTGTNSKMRKVKRGKHMALEASVFAAAQIRQQVGASILAQANLNRLDVAALLGAKGSSKGQRAGSTSEPFHSRLPREGSPGQDRLRMRHYTRESVR